MEQTILIPDSLVPARDGLRTVAIPVGYITLEDLLSHIQYQLHAGTVLTDELEAQKAAEFTAGKRELAETLQAVTESASAAVDMEAAHRILTAETIGYAPH